MSQPSQIQSSTRVRHMPRIQTLRGLWGSADGPIRISPEASCVDVKSSTLISVPSSFEGNPPKIPGQ